MNKPKGVQMRLETLQIKVDYVGDLLGRKLSLGSRSGSRRYRVEDQSKGHEDAILGNEYLAAQDLWNRLDMAETALRLLQSDHNRQEALDSFDRAQ